MTPQTPGDGLCADQLAAARDAWGCGVPLAHMAALYGIPEAELRRQISERQRQLSALADWDRVRRAAAGGQPGE